MSFGRYFHASFEAGDFYAVLKTLSRDPSGARQARQRGRRADGKLEKKKVERRSTPEETTCL